MPVPPTEKHPHLLGVGCVLFTLLGWSSVPLFLKHFSHDIDAWTSNGWRYGFSALCWLPVLLFNHYRGSVPKGLWKAALVPAAFNICGQACFTHGFYYINPGLFTFGLRTQIVFVAVGAVLLFPAERKVVRSPAFIIGAVLVMVGAAGVVLQGKNIFEGATLIGAVLAIASGFLFACYGLAVRKCMTGLPSVLSFAAISQYTAGAMLVLMFTLGDHFGVGAWRLPNDQFALLLLSSVIGIAIGHVAYYMAIARLGVAVSSGIIQLQPFIVSAFSLWLFGETLTVGQWGAGMLAVVGAGVILWTQGRAAKKAKSEK
jgi:drug/metabolite transporter (DMT)-like permease